MRKFFAVLFAVAIFVGLCAFPVFAQETRTVEYFDDGSYCVTEVVQNKLLMGTRSSNGGSKTSTYYDSKNVAIWKMTLTGNFSYNGSTSSCTNANVTVTTYKAGCSVLSKSASPSGNHANATAHVSYLGTTTSRTLTLTCSPNGKLS